MRDVVLNRRILVVNLPALENSDDTLAALGKIVVASLRGMMAQLLGAKLEGEASEIFSLKPGQGDGPFQVAFDEMGYYATSGMDRMYAMGRGLNMMFWSGFQEVSGVWAKLGEKTQSLLGNANLTVAMRQQDANRTREWLEKTAGQTYVIQATSYQGGSVGQYREAQHAEMRQVSRVDWSDLQRLIEGEAIILFAGRRVYAKLFHAKIDTSGPTRLNRPLMLAAPQREVAAANAEVIARVADNLLTGRVAAGAAEPVSPTLAALLKAYTNSIDGDKIGQADAAITAAGSTFGHLMRSGQIIRPRPQQAEPPVTDFLPMLKAAAERRRTDEGPVSYTKQSFDRALTDFIAGVEKYASRSPHDVRSATLAALADRETCFAKRQMERPLPRDKKQFIGAMETLSEALR